MDMEEAMEVLADTAAEAEAPEIVRNFATVGAVYEDGVSLIFDGEEEPTDKHYLCNTSVVFQAGDRVRIFADAGTYIVEYVVGAPSGGGSEVHGIPAGGTSGQMLAKASGTDYDAAWQNVPKELPTSSASVAGRPLLATNGGSEWKEYIPQKFFNHAQSSVGGNDNYIIELKTGAIAGTGASEFYIRMGTTGTWHKIQLA